jgi:predicted membrane chloride channel (bestrophin family)
VPEFKCYFCFCILFFDIYLFQNVRFVAFTLALKHRLRGSVNTEEELADLSGALLPATLDLVMRVNNRPGACLRLMNEYFQDKNTSAELSESLLVTIQGHIAELNTLQYSCERIINTPIPLPYLIQIRQLVFLYGFYLPHCVVGLQLVSLGCNPTTALQLIAHLCWYFSFSRFFFHCSYCITLPLVLVGQFPGIYSLIATSMLSFGLMGIEEAGKIIQNPFGDDDSDLVRLGRPFCRVTANVIISTLCYRL